MTDGLKVLLGLLVVAAIAVALWLGSWALREDSVNREAEIQRGSYQMQDTTRDEIIRQANGLTAVDVQLADPNLTPQQRQALEAQRKGMSRQLCNVAANVRGSVSEDIDEILTQEC